MNANEREYYRARTTVHGNFAAGELHYRLK